MAILKSRVNIIREKYCSVIEVIYIQKIFHFNKMVHHIKKTTKNSVLYCFKLYLYHEIFRDKP